MSRRPRRPHGRSDQGAVAIITAVTAVLLFVVAALAVETTNAFSRQVAVQNVADQAARDGAALLPDACAAVLTAAQALASPANVVPDDRGPLPAVTITSLADIPTLLDGDETNGEIRVFGPDLDLDGTTGGEMPVSLTGCSQPSPTVRATRIVVTAPPRRVDFPLGSLAGADGVAVGGAATAAVVSAVPVLPFALPAACSGDDLHTLVPRLPGEVLALDPNPTRGVPPAPELLFASRQPDGSVVLTIFGDPITGTVSYWVRFSAQGQPDVFTPSSADDPGFPGLRQVVATIPPEVALRPGRWTVRVVVRLPPPADAPPTGNVFSDGFSLRIPTPPIPICDSSGLYGQVLPVVPTAGPGGTAAQRIEAATTDGLAYSLDPAVGGTAAVLSGSATYGDLAAGIEAGLANRLDADTPPCGATPALPAWQPPGWRVLANNALSCYVTVDGAGAWTVDPAIIDDPRLFLVPVVDPGTATRDSADRLVPVTGYRAAFVTAESAQPPPAPPLPCLAINLTCNGIQLSVGGSLERLVIYTFDPALLPAFSRLADNGHPFTLGTRDVILLD